MSSHSRPSLPARRFHLLPLLLLALLAAPALRAQPDAPESRALKPAEPSATLESYATIFLTNTTEQSQAREIVTDLRNMLPHARCYLLEAQAAISVSGTAQDLELARKIVTDLDHPRRSYRLTYTISESENGKRITTQKFTLTAAPGQKAYLRQGKRIPISTGSTATPPADKGFQVQYMDVGMNIEASIDGAPGSLSLHTKVEQSSLADEPSGLGAQDPIIRQSVFEESSTLTPGKALLLGSTAVPGTARSQEIEVLAEPIP